MARNFNGTSDKILMSLGAVPTTLTAFTLIALVRLQAVSRWNNMMTLATSADATVADLTISDTNVLLDEGRTAQQGETITGMTTGWHLVGLSRAAGTAACRGHRYVYSTGVWTHTDSAQAGGNPSGTIARIYLGTFATGDFLSGDLEMAGIWDRALSDAEVENLPYTLMGWHTLAPKAMWKLDQGATTHKIVDITGGGANESTVTGTTVGTNSVPTFNYSDGIWLPTHSAPAAGGTTYQKDGSVIAGSSSTGGDAFTAAETGAAIAGTNESGADSFNPSEAGSLLTNTLTAGADAFTGGRTGSVTAGGLVSGADAAAAAETGSVAATGSVSGADADVFAEAGSVTPGGLLSGADASTFVETAALLAAGLLSGGDAATLSETGALIAGALLSGADAAARAETAAIVAGALLSGASQKNSGGASKTGSLVAGALLSGADAATFGELGSLLASALHSGADARTAAEAGTIAAGALLSGSDVHVAVEAGSLVALARLSGFAAAGPASAPVTVHFDSPSPSARRFGGSPRAGGFDRPSPTKVVA